MLKVKLPYIADASYTFGYSFGKADYDSEYDTLAFDMIMGFHCRAALYYPEIIKNK